MNISGDVLNVMYIINDAFFQNCFRIFNPRNAMYISRNDGKFNNDVNHQKDTIINTNTMMKLSRRNYSKENFDRIVMLTKVSKYTEDVTVKVYK